MLNKWSIKARLTQAEKEGMARLMEAVKEKRDQAAGVNEPDTLPVQPEDVKNQMAQNEQVVSTLAQK